MAYATITGQPMTFLAPTGLTLAFIGALFQFTARAQVPFLPMYAWCGVWTALLLVGLSFANASGLIRYCTRFTEEVSARHRSDPIPNSRSDCCARHHRFSMLCSRSTFSLRAYGRSSER